MNNPKAARRGRGRQQNKNGSQNGRRVVEGNNRSEQRVRGNPIQLLEKYKSLAREATTAGDRILAENYFQYADHYQRLVNERASQRHGQPAERQHERQNDRNDDRQDERQDDERSSRETAPVEDAVEVNGADAETVSAPAQNGAQDSADAQAAAPAKPKRRRRTTKPKPVEDAAVAEADGGGAA